MKKVFIIVLSLFTFIYLTFDVNANTLNFVESEKIEENITNVTHIKANGTITNDKNISTNQNINVLKMGNNVEVVTWSFLSNGKYSLQTTLNIAKNFEQLNPEFEVIAGVNGDYFSTETINSNVIYGNRIIKPSNHQKYQAIEFDTSGYKIKSHKQLNSEDVVSLSVYDNEKSLVFFNQINNLNIFPSGSNQTTVHLNPINYNPDQTNKYFEIKNNVSDKVKLYNGTDEGASVLLAKILVDVYNLNPNVFVHLPYEDTLDKIYSFEDRYFRENLDNMFDVIKLNKSELDNSNYVLSIYAEKEVMNLDLDKYIPYQLDKDETYRKYIDELNDLLKTKDNVALLDLTFPNGGSIELLNDIEYKKIKGYSAWNTPSNALGTLLCDMVCYLINDNDNTFTKERILDDCVYQYVVRRKVNEVLINDEINIFNLGEHGNKTLELIKNEFSKYTTMVDIKSYNIYLPWNRTFEIEIDVEE